MTVIENTDIAALEETLGAPETPAEPAYVHRDGDCLDCQGPCQGHMRDFCDTRWPEIKCTHPPGSRRCDHTTLHDDDETSEQALAAKAQGTRQYSRD